MNLPPVERVPLPRDLTPDQAMERLCGLPHRLLLESAAGAGRTVLSADPRLVLRWHDGRTSLTGPAVHPVTAAVGEGPEGPTGSVPTGSPPPGPDPDPFECLGALLRPRQARVAGRRDGDRPFRGGWIGYLGYETCDLLERLPPPPDRCVGLPSLWMAAVDWAVLWGPGSRGPRLEGAPLAEERRASFRRRLLRLRERLVDGQEETDGEPGADTAPAPADPRTQPSHRDPNIQSDHNLSLCDVGVPVGGVPGVVSTLGRTGYEAGVEEVRRRIRAGDLFQANLTHLLGAPLPAGGGALPGPAAASPVPFAGYVP